MSSTSATLSAPALSALPRPCLILGVESSCDETGLALVSLPLEGEPRLLAHALHSQIDMHQA